MAARSRRFLASLTAGSCCSRQRSSASWGSCSPTITANLAAKLIVNSTCSPRRARKSPVRVSRVCVDRSEVATICASRSHPEPAAFRARAERAGLAARSGAVRHATPARADRRFRRACRNEHVGPGGSREARNSLRSVTRRAVLRGRALCGARRVRRSRNAPRRQTRRVLGPVGCRLRCSRRGARCRPPRAHGWPRLSHASTVHEGCGQQVGRRRGGRSRTRVACGDAAPVGRLAGKASCTSALDPFGAAFRSGDGAVAD